MKQSLRSNRNICDGDLTESEFLWLERCRAEKKENIHLIRSRRRRRKARWHKRTPKQLGRATGLERDKQQLDDEEFAQIYEELMSTNDRAPCTAEDASTYEYLESYWYKQD